jgi:TonB family protein
LLADDLTTALAATPIRLHVQDHSRLKRLMSENSLESKNIFDPGITTWLAEDLGAQALVLGKLERDAGNVKLSVTTYTVRDGRGIVGFEITLPLTDEMKGLIPDTIENESADKFVFPDKRCIAIGWPPCGGVNGHSSPKCLRCPQPQFSEEAKDRRAQGTALFIVIVDENGGVKDIRVVTTLPYGLTRQAVQAIQKWTFQPATAPNGKPVAVRQPIEVSFHLS